ncbi:GFA family protein [Pseudooctadecabacter jejudonensis]|uniref:Glutathione-dependent formaldehyde-activating enzyme n=1 Tax=Pseudooctadecabacter jejudonensis TaxID=1391910 RepID=A0A1Y5SNM7_9RHOB|nr:GFA family protein [Pseudooctadecabacter jejudonensis]SLN44496.1 Glutathione-dependent formaldehyde-activating enzyme [Pseudooctadecabacter jejudonensis]
MTDHWQTGGCLCGAVRYTLYTPPKWTALCHCDSCRRAASAPVVAWMGFAPDAVDWSGERQFYKSSPHANRGFCPTCGSQMSFESDRWPGEIHLYGVSLDTPEAYVPQLHCYTDEHLDWLRLSDDLPRFAQSADSEPAGPPSDRP